MPKLIFPPFNEKYVRSTPMSANKKCFLHIYGAGIVYPDERYEFSKIRDTYIFEYIVSGSGFVESEAMGYTTLSQGDCVVASKGKFLHYGADKKNPYVKMWFSVTGDFIKPLFDACLSADTDYIVRKVNAYPLFEKMLSVVEGNDKDDVAVLSPIILEILLTVAGRITPKTENISPRAAQLKRYIDNFLLDGADIKRAAEHIGISERAAKKAFTDETGISPSRYIRQKKLEHAKELLEHTEKTVTEIAHIIHYCDQSYFSTDFKKEYGIYPTDHWENVIRSRKKR